MTIGKRRVTFVVQHRVNGDQRTVTLGHWGPPKVRTVMPNLMSVARAREAAMLTIADMRRGEDPTPWRVGDEVLQSLVRRIHAIEPAVPSGRDWFDALALAIAEDPHRVSRERSAAASSPSTFPMRSK